MTDKDKDKDIFKNKKISDNTYKGDIIKLIGLSGQFQCNRSEYFFPNTTMFRRYVRELVYSGYIAEDSPFSNGDIENLKDYKNLFLEPLGKKVLEELYPDIYEYYKFTTQGRIRKAMSSAEDKQAYMIKSLKRSIKLAILNISDLKEQQELLDEFESIKDNSTKRELLNFKNKNKSIKKNFNLKMVENPNTALLRTLKTGSVISFIYNNNVCVLPSQKQELDLNDDKKYNLPEKKLFFFQARELKNIFGENVDFAKAKGIIFKEDKTFVLYNINSINSMWEYAHEQKFISNLKVFENKKFNNRSNVDIQAILFYRDDTLAVNYLSDRDNITNLSALDNSFSSILYIPLFTNIMKKIDGDTDEVFYDFSNEKFQVAVSDYNSIFINKLLENISNTEEVGESSYMPFDFFSKKYNEETCEYDMTYHFSFLNSDILRLKKILYFAEALSDKVIIYAFNTHKNIFSHLPFLSKNIEIKYLDIRNVKLREETIFPKLGL